MAKGEWEVLSPPERKRVYVYASGDKIFCENVARVKVSESGNHYLDADSITHVSASASALPGFKKGIIPAGWQAILLDMDAWTF